MDLAASKELFKQAAAQLKANKFLKKMGVQIISSDYPDLIVDMTHPSGAHRLFRFRCDDWNAKPPSVKSVDSEGNELAGEPAGPNFSQLSSGWGLCAVGTREYHEHHQQDNPWHANQVNVSLGDVVFTVASHYAKANA